MDASEWMARFRELHGRKKAAVLAGTELERYLSMREELARSLAAAQGQTVPEGQSPRKHFKVAQVFQLEVNNLYKSLTREVSRSSFSSVVPTSLSEKDKVNFAITLARGEDPVTGQGVVVSSLKQQGSSRVTVNIEVLSEANAERLEQALYDAVLARYK